MENQKKGFFSKVFGSQKPSCCCNVEVEEVKEEEQDKNAGAQSDCCCGPKAKK